MLGFKSGFHTTRRPLTSRSGLVVQAKLKISQNHKKAQRINLKDEELLSDPLYIPPRQFGPVELRNIPGKGRGLIAGVDLKSSDTLIVSEPAGKVARGSEGAILGVDDIILSLEKDNLSYEDRFRLAMLCDGTAASLSRPITLKNFTEPGEKKKESKAVKGFGAPSKSDAELPGAEEMVGEQLRKVVHHNAWSAPYSDMGAAPRRKERSYAHAGVWPEYALLNHSCIPNTINLLVGDRLLVRAASPIPRGGEITTSYIGSEAGGPLSHRRKYLKDNFGFSCMCARCKTESAAPAKIGAQLNKMWTLCQEGGVVKRLKDLIANKQAQEDDAFKEVRKSIADHVFELEELMEKHALDKEARVWLRASAYVCYELLAVVYDNDPSPSSATQAALAASASYLFRKDGEGAGTLKAEPLSIEKHNVPASLIPMLITMCPGSDTHIWVALEWVMRVSDAVGGKTSQEVQAATQCLLAAVVHRYGRVADDTYTALLTNYGQVKFYLGRPNLPSPWGAVKVQAPSMQPEPARS